MPGARGGGITSANDAFRGELSQYLNIQRIIQHQVKCISRYWAITAQVGAGDQILKLYLNIDVKIKAY